MASWYLVRDTAFCLLEQLLGSLLVGATISTQLRLRSFNITGEGLLPSGSCHQLAAMLY